MNFETSEGVMIWAGVALACAVLSAIIARARGLSPATYFVWGLITGPLGVLFAAASKRVDHTGHAPVTTDHRPPRFSISELERLAALRTSGALTDAEFARAKERLLAS